MVGTSNQSGRAIQAGNFNLDPDPEYVKELISPRLLGFDTGPDDYRNFTVQAKA
jgi:hypothetical protein